MILYKIRNKDGKYSSGGHPPKWLKTGKVWTLPSLKAHFSLITTYSKSLSCYQDCELVTFAESQDPAKITLTALMAEHEQKLIVQRLTGSK